MLSDFGQSFQSVLKVFEIHPHFFSLIQWTLCGVTPQVKKNVYKLYSDTWVCINGFTSGQST